MSVFPSYSTGTVSVAANGTAVTGVGTNWSGVNAMPGDVLQIGAFQTIVSDVTSATAIVVPPWGGGNQAGAAYKIWKTSPLRFGGGQAAADVSRLIAALNMTGFFVFVGAGESVPDPSYGEDGQFAYQPSTGKTWAKTGGVWVLQASLSIGIRQAYSTTTADADPGAGAFRLNHATPASATAAYLDNLDANGVAVSGVWDQFDDSTNPVRGVIRFQKASDPTVWAQFNVTGAVVDGSGYRKLTLAAGAASGAFTNADVFVIAFFRAGDAGSAGPQGTASGVRQAYSTTTADADPGNGIFRLNNAAPASATAAYLDNLDAGGVTVSGIWDQFDDSTSTVRGVIRFQKASDPAVWAQYNVTGSVVDGTGYRKLTLASGAASGAFTNGDVFAITFSRSGNSSAGDMTGANNLSDVASPQISRGNLGIIYPPQGRLTLVTGVPVMTSNQTAKTVLFYTPAVGNQIPIYDGSKFVPTAFSELSIATTDTTKNPAAIGVSKVNDWFVWDDAGTKRLTHGPDWTNDTTRSAGTNLARINGIIVNDVAITNGPAQYRGTYVGTTRSDGSSQLDWILGGSASGGTAGFLGVWNAYNRVSVSASSIDNGATYSYSSSTVRQARGSSGNQINFVVGLNEDIATAAYTALITNSAVVGAQGNWGIGFDSTSVYAFPKSVGQTAAAAGLQHGHSNFGSLYPGIGFHFFSANEHSDGANNQVWNDQNNNTLTVTVRA